MDGNQTRAKELISSSKDDTNKSLDLLKELDYVIVSHRTAAEVSGAVSVLVNNDWFLYGPPFSHDGNICQAMKR